jgi:hypothetical protein
VSEAALKILDGGKATKPELDQLRKQIVSCKEQLDRSNFEMAGLLYRANAIGAHRDWGYPMWKDYIEQELGMSERKSQYLMAIWHWYEKEIGTDAETREKVEELGVTKVNQLSKVATKNTLDEWVDRAQDMTVTELTESVKSDRLGKGPNPEEVPSKLWFSLFPGQLQTVEDALEIAESMAESDKRGHLLEMVCRSFVAQAVFQTRPGDKLACLHLNRIANVANKKLVIIDKASGDIVSGLEFLQELADQ